MGTVRSVSVVVTALATLTHLSCAATDGQSEYDDAGIATGGTDAQPGGGGTGAATGGATGGNAAGGALSGNGGMPAAAGGMANMGAGGSTMPSVPKPTCDKQIDSPSGPGCEAVVEGLQVKFFPVEMGTATSGSTSKRLAVYLHGDTAGDWYNTGYIDPLATWGRPKDVMVIAPLSPAQNSGGDLVWWSDKDTTVPMLEAVLSRFVQSYGLSTTNVLYSGVSGGAQFMTRQWLLLAGDEFQGVFAHNCGGDRADWDVEPDGWDTSNASFRDLFALQFNYGSDDFLAPSSEMAMSYWGGLGFSVSEIEHPGATHCNHDITGPTLDFWESNF